LDMPDTTVGSTIDDIDRVPGCFLNKEGSLKINEEFDSTSPATNQQINLCVECTLPSTIPPSTVSTESSTAVTSTVPTEFKAVYGPGVCRDGGSFCPIETVNQCERAARTLDIPNTNTQVSGTPLNDFDTVSGCYWNNNGKLKINEAFGSAVQASWQQINLCVECTLPSTEPPSTVITDTTPTPPLYNSFDEGGKCRKYGSYCPIQTENECERAATILDLPDTTIDGNPIFRNDRVAGCWLTRQNSLKINEDSNSKASALAGQTIICVECTVPSTQTEGPTTSEEPSTSYTTEGPTSSADTTSVLSTSENIAITPTTGLASTSSPYAIVMGGKCSNLGSYCPLETKETCEIAANSLNLVDTIVSGYGIDTQDRVAGCFLSKENRLKFNLALDSPADATNRQTNVCKMCILPTEPFRTTEAIPNYATRKGGVCSDLDPSYRILDSRDECEAAAAALQLSDTKLGGNTLLRSDRVAGCFLNRHGSLKFNEKFSSIRPAMKTQTIICVGSTTTAVPTTKSIVGVRRLQQQEKSSISAGFDTVSDILKSFFCITPTWDIETSGCHIIHRIYHQYYTSPST
jgi:hypothetical protein